MCIRHTEAGIVFLLPVAMQKVAMMAGKFVTIETRGQSQSNLASSCLESMMLLLTAMKNNLNPVLFVNQGNNLVSLAWPLLLSQRDCKWFWKNSLFTS